MRRLFNACASICTAISEDVDDSCDVGEVVGVSRGNSGVVSRRTVKSSARGLVGGVRSPGVKTIERSVVRRGRERKKSGASPGIGGGKLRAYVANTTRKDPAMIDSLKSKGGCEQ